MPARPEIQYRCSFCGSSQEQVHRLIAGPGGVYICNECVDLCRDIIAEDIRLNPVHVDQAVSMLNQTQQRYERDRSLCPLCRNLLEEGEAKLVVAAYEGPGDRRDELWRCHASCFGERARRLT